MMKRKKKLKTKAFEFVEELRTKIKPRSQSYRIAFRRLAGFFLGGRLSSYIIL